MSLENYENIIELLCPLSMSHNNADDRGFEVRPHGWSLAVLSELLSCRFSALLGGTELPLITFIYLYCKYSMNFLTAREDVFLSRRARPILRKAGMSNSFITIW